MDAHSEDTQLQLMLSKIDCSLRDGLKHGFFEISITCEIINGRKRQVRIKAGKSDQFVILENEGR